VQLFDPRRGKKSEPRLEKTAGRGGGRKFSQPQSPPELTAGGGGGYETPCRLGNLVTLKTAGTCPLKPLR
jgi:hypothetical protein